MESSSTNIELEPLQNYAQHNTNLKQFDDDLEQLLHFEADADSSSESKRPVVGLSKGQSSVAKATFNMTKTIVGAGVFGLPFTFHKAGFFTVFILIIVMAIFINWTLQVLLRAGLNAKVDSYHDLMFKCFGKQGSLLYGIFAFFFAFGGMCAYTVIIGDTVPGVIRALFGVAALDAKLSPLLAFFTDRRIVIAICSFCIMLPVSSVRNITALAKFSIFALVAIILIALLVVIDGSMLAEGIRGTQHDATFTFLKMEGLSAAIGTLCFAYVCHHNTFIIFKSLRFPTVKNFDMVNFFSLGYACLCSLFIGVTGYVIFKEKTSSNILNSFPSTDAAINFARALFALDMFLTYPLELFIARNTLFKSALGINPETTSLLLHMGCTIGLVIATTVIGLSTCNLGVVFDLTGGLAASTIAFIFPSACTLKMRDGPIFHAANISHILCIGFGIFVLLLTTTSTIAEAFSSKQSEGFGCKNINF